MPGIFRHRLEALAERARRLRPDPMPTYEIVMVDAGADPAERAAQVADVAGRGARPIVVTIAPPVTREERERQRH